MQSFKVKIKQKKKEGEVNGTENLIQLSSFCRKKLIIKIMDIIKKGKEGFSVPEFSNICIKLEACVPCSCIRTSQNRRKEGILIYTLVKMVRDHFYKEVSKVMGWDFRSLHLISCSSHRFTGCLGTSHLTPYASVHL